MISKLELIKLIKNHTYKDKKKINKIGVISLYLLQKKNVKVFSFSDFPWIEQGYSRLFKQKAYIINCAFFNYSLNAIVLNEKILLNDNDLVDSCIHELNHLFNKNKEYEHIIEEFNAFSAEYLFRSNKDRLNFSEKEYIFFSRIYKHYPKIKISDLGKIRTKRKDLFTEHKYFLRKS